MVSPLEQDLKNIRDIYQVELLPTLLWVRMRHPESICQPMGDTAHADGISRLIELVPSVEMVMGNIPDSPAHANIAMMREHAAPTMQIFAQASHLLHAYHADATLNIEHAQQVMDVLKEKLLSTYAACDALQASRHQVRGAVWEGTLPAETAHRDHWHR